MCLGMSFSTNHRNVRVKHLGCLLLSGWHYGTEWCFQEPAVSLFTLLSVVCWFVLWMK